MSRDEEAVGMDVHQSIEIAASPQRIWPLLVEPDDVLKWYVTLETFEYAEGEPHGPGARVYAEEHGPGMLMKLNFELSDWVEYRTLALHMLSGTGVRAYDQRWTLEPLPTGSRFTFTEHVELPYGVLGRVIGQVARRTSEGHVKEMLARLKALAES